MPTPPSQCVKQRQNKMDRAMASRLSTTLAPHVVRPEKDSKRAGTKRRLPENTKGRALNTPANTQPAVTRSNASR